MITMEFSLEVGRAIYRLIEVAERKGKQSLWWRELVEPIVGVRPPPRGGMEASSFREDLGRAIGPIPRRPHDRYRVSLTKEMFEQIVSGHPQVEDYVYRIDGVELQCGERGGKPFWQAMGPEQQVKSLILSHGGRTP